MRIEILYVPGCPNYQPTVERVRAVLSSEAVKTGILGIPVTTEVEAKALSFPGSPTVRVNGEDVELRPTSVPSLACRLLCKSKWRPLRGVAAESDFRRESEGVKTSVRVAERATPVAAVIVVLAALSCCLPFTFLGALGLAGASVRLQSLRPWLLATAGILLVVGFIQLYVRRNQCQKRSPLSIALFWVAAVVVLLVILFPQVIASLIAG
jgi:hypothetical protein